MRPRLLTVLPTLCLSLPLLGACAGSAPVSQTTSAVAATSQTLSLEEGQRLSFIFLDVADGEAAATVRRAYSQNVFPLAQTYGLEIETGFSVVGVRSGSFEPQRVALFTWPNAEQERAFNSEEAFKAAKATRPEGWDHLRVATITVAEDVAFVFDPDKTYSLASAWFSADNPDDYAAYLTSIEDGVAASGGRFVQEFRKPDFETHSGPDTAPDQLTLVEWDSRSGLRNFLRTDSFRQYGGLLTTGTRRFELLLLEVETP